MKPNPGDVGRASFVRCPGVILNMHLFGKSEEAALKVLRQNLNTIDLYYGKTNLTTAWEVN